MKTTFITSSILTVAVNLRLYAINLQSKRNKASNLKQQTMALKSRPLKRLLFRFWRRYGYQRTRKRLQFLNWQKFEIEGGKKFKPCFPAPKYFSNIAQNVAPSFRYCASRVTAFQRHLLSLRQIRDSCFARSFGVVSFGSSAMQFFNGSYHCCGERPL